MYKSLRECAEMIEDLFDNGDLSEWEEHFLDSLSRQETLSPKQRETLDKIHTEKLGERR